MHEVFTCKHRSLDESLIKEHLHLHITSKCNVKSTVLFLTIFFYPKEQNKIIKKKSLLGIETHKNKFDENELLMNRISPGLKSLSSKNDTSNAERDNLRKTFLRRESVLQDTVFLQA